MTSDSAMQPGVCCTVVTVNHLPYARVLMQSVKEFWPAAQRQVLLADGTPTVIAGLKEDFAVTTGESLFQEGFLKRAFLNSAGGLCAMLKPFFVAHLLRTTGTPLVVYADGDSRFYSTPDALLKSAHQGPLLVTPHTLNPIRLRGKLRTDGDIARAGTYNSGLFCIRNTTGGLACADFWAQGMWHDAWQNQEFAWDQIWLPLLRHHFPDTVVLNDPQYNVAYWNLHERTDIVTDRANAGRLVHFHFSFFDPFRPDYLAHRWGQIVPAEPVAVAALCRSYAEALRAADLDGVSKRPYGYSCFDDGTPISDVQRLVYRRCIAQPNREWDNPFDPAFTPPGAADAEQIYRYHSPRSRLRRAIGRVAQRFGLKGNNA